MKKLLAVVLVFAMIALAVYFVMNVIDAATQQQRQIKEEIDAIAPSEVNFYAMRNSYRVNEVLYSADNQHDLAELPIIVVDDSVLRFSHKGSSPIDGIQEIGTFMHMPTEVNPDASVWELDTNSGGLYRFYIDEDGRYILDYFGNQELIYSWHLTEAEVLKVRLYGKNTEKSRYPSWWHSDSFEPDLVENYATHLRYSISMALIFPEKEQPTEITIQEDFYMGDELTVRQHSAVADENGRLFFDVPFPGLDEECYSIFRIPYEGGEFILCFTYEPGEEAWDAFMYDL